MRKYIVEFIGTFFLVMAVCAAVRMQANNAFMNFAPLAIGLGLIAMIYAGRDLSGAHYNPAVSLAIFIRGKMSLVEMIGYWVVQLMAGVIAALIASNLFNYKVAVDAELQSIPGALFAEILGTFALAYVVLNVATSPKTANNQYYGIAIGFTVVGMAYTVGPASGGAFNPAVALGLSAFGKIDWSVLWIYVVGAFAGGFLAAMTYRLLRFDIE